VKKCTRCGEIKPLEEYGVRKSAKDGRKSGCKKCLNNVQKEFYRSESGRQKYYEYERTEHRKQLRKKPEATRKKKIAEQQPHRVAKKKEYGRKYCRQHHVKERMREYKRKYPEKVSADNANRRARKLNATPPWLNDEHKAEITATYKEMRRLRNETGIEHHVDHIIPLRGKDVCGLHVPWNLQILTADENYKKGIQYER
jgi:hypothetical protein